MTRVVIYDTDLAGIQKLRSFLLSIKGLSEEVETVQDTESLYHILDKAKDKEIVVLFITRELIVTEIMMLNYLRMQKSVSVIFCGREEWAYRAWQWRVFDFLRIPVRKKDLMTVFSRYLNEKSNKKESVLALKFQGGIYRIRPDDIVFVKGDGNYSRIWLRDGNRLLVTRKIGEMTNLLRSYEYIQRVGKSYIFNLSLVRSINASEITFAGHKSVVVKFGPTYTKRIQELITNE